MREQKIMTKLEQVLPSEIEKRSFEIITEELGARKLNPEHELVIKRVIHTTADFDYAENLVFSVEAVAAALEALLQGTCIVTDTNMGKAGINKKTLGNLAEKSTALWQMKMWQRPPEKTRLQEQQPVWIKQLFWEKTAFLPLEMPQRH